MTKRDIEIMKTTKRLKLSLGQQFDHYFIVLFLSIIPIYLSYDLIKILIGTYDGERSASELFNVQLPFMTLAIIAYFNQKRRLKFKIYTISHEDDEFQEAVRRTADSLGRMIETNRRDFMRAFRTMHWLGSWGDMITIIRDGNTILLNSISDPNLRPTFSSFGWDKKNVKVFLRYLMETKQGIPQNTEYEEEEARKWYAKKYMRYLAYFCSAGLTALSAFLLNEGMISQAITLIMLVVFYISSDLGLMREERNRSRASRGL